MYKYLTRFNHVSTKNFNKLIHKNSSSNETTRCSLSSYSSTFTNQFVPPFVGVPYSYAYGRSLNHLIYETIGQRLDERVKYESGKPVIVFHHENIQKTFTEFYEDVLQLSKSMYENLNIQHGDVVGIWSCNIYDWIVVQYACLRIGAILCTVNPYYQSYELDYAIRKGEMKSLFLPGPNSRQQIVNRFSTIAMKTLDKKSEDNNLPLLLENIISIDGDAFNSNDLPEHLRNKIRLFELKKLKQSNNNGNELDRSILDSVLPDDPAIIMFTSGTTGRPKGACLSHFNIINNALLSATKAIDNPNSKYCVPLPFFHSFAGVLGALIPISKECSQVLVPCLKYNVEQLVEVINKYGATHLMATPTLVIDLINYVRHHEVQLPTMKRLYSGGAAMPIELAYQFMKYAPDCKVCVAYGSTETSPCSTVFSSESTIEESVETVGSPLDFVEVKLIDPKTKSVVKIGETGELHCRGHVVMLGYWRDPEKTKEAIDEGGWYNSGDLAVMNEKGMVRIIGRTKELIIVGGENVYPREIEEILYTHPAVDIVNVIGVPDKRKGEEICAWIKLHDDIDQKPTENEIRTFCQEKLTYFKVPRYILFVDSFPMTATGKAQKFLMQKITNEKLKLQTS